MVTGFWQVFALLGHLGFATVLTVWPNDFGRHPRLIRAIDTPGFLSDETATYAKNADIAIIPVQPGTLGLKPMKRTIKVITEANPDLSFAIIVNNFAANQTVDRQFLELLEADDLPVLGTVPTAAAFKQGAALGKPVYEIAKSGKAALAIENILDEIEEVL